jgi:glycerol-3-phosphate dehydrogenase
LSAGATGGATGTGAALDAATRGLRTALVEAEDFAAGTSSRSTKLIHGGVRYLEKAVLQVKRLAVLARMPARWGVGAGTLISAPRVRTRAQLDYGQLKLVFDALHERLHMLRAAPHLTNAVPIMMPCYKLWEARDTVPPPTVRAHRSAAAEVCARAHVCAGALLLGGAEGVRPRCGDVCADVVAL